MMITPTEPDETTEVAAPARKTEPVRRFSKRPSVRFMVSDPAHFLALGLGSGLSPIMPGTAGTLFGWLCFRVLTDQWPAIFTQGMWAVIIVVGFVLGVFVCDRAGRALGVPDHGAIVWDEIIAIWLVLLLVTPCSFKAELIAVILFRVFDMVKPPPIRQIERRYKGGFGVMIDDILAAFFTLLVIALWRF
ncbi:MAG: phosphatidylglycerophosphatase A [Betaproteobacteria bacterium]